MSDLSAIPLAELESLRMRLTQLTHSLTAMLAQLQMPKLPPWPTLQGQFNVLLTQLASLSGVIHSSADTLQRTVAYPLPNFPTDTQIGLLTTLLRKKNVPQVDDWIKEGLDAGKDVTIRTHDDFCQWALAVVDQAKDEHEWSGFEMRNRPSTTTPSGTATAAPTPGPSGNQPWTLDEVLTFMSKGEIPK